MKNQMSIKIKKLEKENLPEFTALIRLFKEVFEMIDFSIPDSDHLLKLLKHDNFAVFVAKKENLVVGGLTVYELEQYYSEKPLAYIYDLAVITNFQGRGIGKKLIEQTNRFYQTKGFEAVFVLAEKIDNHAIDFYRRTAHSEEEQVVSFNYRLID